MNRIERAINQVRHSFLLENLDWVWDRLRTPYEKVLALKKSGLQRNINGTDPILVSSKYRQLPESYEPDVWRAVMGSVRKGDVVADVGAFVGIYSLAFAGRVGHAGRVIAIEPDPENFAALEHHAALNGLQTRISCVRKAVGSKSGKARFAAGRSVESSITEDDAISIEVQMTTLDELSEDKTIHLVKIDVEGHELEVIRGAVNLMGDSKRRPRAFFVELHQFAWSDPPAYAQHLSDAFAQAGYRLNQVDGKPVNNLQDVRWLVAEV